MKRWAVIFIALSLCLAVYGALQPRAQNWAFVVPDRSAAADLPASFDRVLTYDSPVGTAHSAAIRILDESAEVMWFDGTAEAARDVQVLTAPIDGGEPRPLLTPDTVALATAPAQAVWVLGNTIQTAPGEVDLFATVVSLGGWAAASVARVSIDGEIPVKVEKLQLSPALNRSNLVRAPIVRFENGDFAVPTYFEMGTAFGVLARVSPEGRVVDTRRMTQQHRAIQPMIVPLSPARAVAFLRDFEPTPQNVIATWTEDGGRSWSPEVSLDLPNPGAPVAAVRLSTGAILMAFNNSATHAKTMDLAISEDEGRNWRVLTMVEDGRTGPMAGNARYPAMRYLPDGRILLAYSVGGKRGIRAVAFTESWVLAQ